MDQRAIERNPLYMACHPYIRDHVLDLALPDDMTTFDYVPSTHGDPRYMLLEQYSRYSPDHVQWKGDTIGPVEEALLHFVFDERHLSLLVLVGGLGCGKTTTLRYLTDTYIRAATNPATRSTACYIDFTKSLPSEIIGEPHLRTAGLPSAPELPADSSVFDDYLLAAIGRTLHPLLTYEEEIRDLWTWALLPDDAGTQHSSKFILYDASLALRRAGAGDYGASEEAEYLSLGVATK